MYCIKHFISIILLKNIEAFSLLLAALIFFNRLSGQESVIFKENFSYPNGPLPEQWWCEGNSAKIVGQRLFVDADTLGHRVATIWLNKEFSRDLRIEFDVCVISSKEVANNLNFFLFFSHPSNATLKTSAHERSDGKYSYYHKLRGYIITHLANGSEIPARFRFRVNPDFKLLHEVNTFECRKGVIYKVKIEKSGNTLHYFVKNNLIFKKEVLNSDLIGKGIIGFRTYRTSLWWDNLIITKL